MAPTILLNYERCVPSMSATSGSPAFRQCRSLNAITTYRHGLGPVAALRTPSMVHCWSSVGPMASDLL